MSFLTGGSSSSNSSSNQAYPWLKQVLGGSVTTGTNALNQEAAGLGSFQQYQNESGFNSQLNQGTRALSGSAAAQGILNSGETAKGIANYETQLGQQSYQNYLNDLGNVAGAGLGAAQTIGAAGTVSSGSGSSNNGLLSWL